MVKYINKKIQFKCLLYIPQLNLYNKFFLTRYHLPHTFPRLKLNDIPSRYNRFLQCNRISPNSFWSDFNLEHSKISYLDPSFFNQLLDKDIEDTFHYSRNMNPFYRFSVFLLIFNNSFNYITFGHVTSHPQSE